jgi:acetylglutamate kinase
MTTTVIKLGGSSIDQLQEMLDFIKGRRGDRVVVVHGGGPQISDVLQQIGHEPEFRDGLGVTDPETLGVVEMVLAGQVNTHLVAAMSSRGIPAVGLSGVDGETLRAERKAGGRWGEVGETPLVRTALLECLLGGGFVPVLAPLSLGTGEERLNVNADTTAAAVAAALKADSLLFLTDVAGVLGAQGEPLAELSPRDVDHLRQSGVISIGMIPKLEAALFALGQGVPNVEIRSPKAGPGTRMIPGEDHVTAVC